MKKTNRGILYKYCIEYIKTLAVRQELFFHDPLIECEKTEKRIEGELCMMEDKMKKILEEE